MKILMFGWEFPPHISGGLGTACYGLTKGLSKVPDLDVIFVVPKAFGDEEKDAVQIIGANEIPVVKKNFTIEGFMRELNIVQVGVNLVPYLDPEEYKNYITKQQQHSGMSQETEHIGKLEFTGKYGANLFQEISNYALVASVIGKDLDFDVIHAHDWLTYPAGIAAKLVSGKPLVVHVHATDFDRSGGNVNPSVFAIEKQGMQLADKVITVSNLTRKIVIEKYEVDPDKVVTVYNAVEPVAIKENLITDRPFQEKIVTFLGRITMQKGPEYFVEVAHKVLQRMDNVRFVMAGSGDMMNKMIARAAKLKIMDKFHFTGFLSGDDVFRMFYMSDVYVMPSISEPFGISPLEAMQSNVPVIISHQSGVAEILNHAVKVDFWDINAMADAIYGILNYPALHTMFTKHGKIEVEGLKWETSAQKVKEVYDMVYSN
ncbi:MAG TPA: glycosyltransferase family 4 protein [Bacteroidales bacterium]|nr:glycosyltransferase family 4 protein [Bacteroidales bacterium]